ncbi:hypothetical protein S83_068381 [Arachis hypogaea]
MLSLFTALYSVQIRCFVCRERGALVSKREKQRNTTTLEALLSLSLSLSLCCIVLFYHLRISSHFHALKCCLSLSLSLVIGGAFSFLSYLLECASMFLHFSYWSLLPCSYTFLSVARTT